MDKLSVIRKFLANKTNSYGFYLKNLKNDKEIKVNEEKIFPICSCFKLAVLMALFNKINNKNDLHEIVKISPTEFSPGGGIINFLDTDVSFTLYQLCQCMMAFSDGTATDYLIDFVGMKAVQEELCKHTSKSIISQKIIEMVSDFHSNVDIKSLKNDNVTFDYEFKDYTTVKDLSLLVKAADNFNPGKGLIEEYKKCLNVKKQHKRLGIYFNEKYSITGKTGSLGFGYFAGECGIIKYEGKPVALFSIFGEGFKDDYSLVDCTFGFLGLKILDYLGLDNQPNLRFSLRSEHLLEKV